MGASRRARAGVMAAAMALVLSGCALHRNVQPFVLPPFTPVELAEVAAPADPPMVEMDEDDEEDLPPVPVAEGASVPKRQRRRVVKAAVPSPPPDAPVQVTAAAPPTETASVIGEFTPGGDLDPKAQKEAADLIAANDKRLSALPADVARGQAGLVSNVRNFQKQAQEALRAGDAAGAKTLATKGKLLLDDLEKAAGM